MKIHWLQKTMLAFTRFTYEDGSRDWMLLAFGIRLKEHAGKDILEYNGIRVSLYDVIIIRNFSTDPKDLATIPLLSAIIGEEVSAEIPHPEDASQVYINNKRYVITPHTRYKGYDRIKRWHKTDIMTVYGITSPDDLEIPEYTFASPEWKGKRPSANQVINQAHELYRLVQGI